MKIIRHIKLNSGNGSLRDLYDGLGNPYPKFFKMDGECRLGYVASEMLLAQEPDRFTPREDTAVLVFTRRGSLDNDRNFEKTIRPGEFPSPALFVYTLPNTVTGEIAIRNKFLGESSAFVLDGFDADEFVRTVKEAFMDPVTGRAVAGWLDYGGENDFEAFLMLIEREGEGFDKETTNILYNA